MFNLLKYVSLLPGVEARAVYRINDTEPECCSRDERCIPIRMEKSIFNLDEYLVEYAASVDCLFRATPFDIVHTSGSEAGMVMYHVRRNGMSVPWVHTNYATLSVRKVVVEGMSRTTASSDSVGNRESICLQTCDHVIALSNVDSREINAVFDIPLQKISVVTPGIDRDIFYPPQENRKRAPVIITAGRMSEIKDFPFLMRSFRLLVESSPVEGLKLLIIGGNNKERESLGLPSLAKSLGIDNRIVFQDGVSQKNLAEQFRAASVFAGTSMHETFGLLPVEARACGTPFVVRFNSSYVSTAEDSFGGYFSDNNSEADMAQKLGLILNLDEQGWLQMSGNAVRSTERFSWPATAESCFAVYEKIALQDK